MRGLPSHLYEGEVALFLIFEVVVGWQVRRFNPHKLSSCVKYYGITYHGILYGHAHNNRVLANTTIA